MLEVELKMLGRMRSSAKAALGSHLKNQYLEVMKAR